MTPKIEFVAHCLAARKMALVKDRNGARLPEELWMQCVPEVEFVLEALRQWEIHEVVRRYHESEEGEE
jgi:hypothetical protein